MDNIDLKYIKKHYGENFAKLCRELFPTILEKPGELSKIISEKFDPSPTLFEDISNIKLDFKTFVYSIFSPEKNKRDVIENKTAEQLLDEAGYILYPECKTEDDIQQFKKYYTEEEAICTFDGGRLNSCRVWFAVKKDVDKIKRDDFPEPKRQDEYGTSVISIQFSKEIMSTLSIKNRYNHTVTNPDATFGNDLDNIIPGLSNAFCKEYNIHLLYGFDGEFGIFGYVLSGEGKYYKSNVADWTADYCANNNIVKRNGDVVSFDKSKCLLVDNYLIDFVSKRIKNLSSISKADNFAESIGEIKSIHISLDQSKNRVINITPVNGEDVQIVVNKSNQIVEYTNNNIKFIGKEFMYFCSALEKLTLPNVKVVEDNFLVLNESLLELNMPKLETVGAHFLTHAAKLKTLNTPNLKVAGDWFLADNYNIQELYLPKLEKVGNSFFACNHNIKKLDFPKLRVIGDSFFPNGRYVVEVNMPELIYVGDYFLLYNDSLESLRLPSLEFAGRNFMLWNRRLCELYLPKIESVGKSFLFNNSRFEHYEKRYPDKHFTL